MTPFSDAKKRAFDVAVALPVMVALAPVLVGIAIMIRLIDGAPVLFRQDRPGRDGRIFTLIKFRTMTDKSASDGSPVPDGQRQTSLGRLLRRLSLDELPQLWNVIVGDMSLVGPRPLLVEYLQHYSSEQMRRHEVRPGMTGWAQVNGRNALGWEERFKLDVWYVDNRSIFLDVKILWMTIKRVLKREDIAHPGQATMRRFTGRN